MLSIIINIRSIDKYFNRLILNRYSKSKTYIQILFVIVEHVALDDNLFISSY